MDSHAVLELSPGASPTEIKRAYRRLAMRWHPDRNSSPEASERFKQIRRAYEELTSARTDSDEAPEENSPEEDAPAAAEPERCDDIAIDLDLGLEEAADGCRKAVHFWRSTPCRRCGGSGKAPIRRTRFCKACQGTGRRMGSNRKLTPCDECAGRGYFSDDDCTDCSGSGRQRADAALEVVVPSGMLGGETLRLAGQGENSQDDRAPGHLYVSIRILPHGLYRLDGRDLILAMPVNALALLAGGSIRVPTLRGNVTHDLAPGRPESRRIRIPGLGYPGRGTTGPGDLIVDCEPVFPENLSPELRKSLLALARSLEQDADAMPELAEWRRSHGD